eukprot:m.30364 g.30364  ORF g.30364 m.30364 type:complete len:1564 (+) comp4700_c0_seq1:36-4727(+)
MASLTPVLSTGLTGRGLARSGKDTLLAAAGPFIHTHRIAHDADLPSTPNVLVRAEGPVLNVAASEGSDTVAYVQDDNSGCPVIVLLRPGMETTILSRPDEPDLVQYDSITLSSDGSRLVTADASPSSTLIVWDLDDVDPVELHRKPLPTAGPYTVSVCPSDHNVFAAVSTEHVLRWELENCGDLTALTHSESRAQVSTRITRRGSMLGRTGRRSSVASMLHLDKYIRKGRSNKITAHCWAPDGEVYIGTDEGVLYLTDGGASIASEISEFLERDLGAVASLVLLPSGILVAAGAGATVCWIDPRDSHAVVRKVSLPGAPTYMCPAPDATQDDVVVCGNGFARITSADTTSPIAAEVCSRAAVVGIAGTRDLGQVAVAFAPDGSGCLWDCVTGSVRGTIPAPAAPDTDTATVQSTMSSSRSVTSLACSPVSGLVLVGWSDGYICGYNVLASNGAWEELFSLSVLPSAVKCIVIDDRGASFCLAGDTRLLVFDAATIAPVGALSFEGAARDISLDSSTSGEKRRLVVLHGDDDTNVTLTGLMIPSSVSLVPKALAPLVHKSVTAPTGATAVTVTWNSVLVHCCEDDITVLEWSTLKPDTSRPQLPGHIFAADVQAASVAGRAVATVGSEGAVLARFLRDPQSVVEPAVGLGHRPSLVGGTGCAVAMSSDGHYIVSTGGDGEVIVWAWTAVAEGQSTAALDLKATAADNASHAAPLPVLRGVHHEDDAAELTGVGEGAAGSEEAESDAKKDLRRKVAKLRAKVMALVEQNEKKPEIERLDRGEFQVDLAEQERLMKEGDAAMEALKDDIELKILAQQFLRHRIKKMCWDAMEVRGLAVYTYDGKLEVSNYPLPKRSRQDIQELRKVQFARKVELEVARRTTPRTGQPLADEEEEDHEDSLMYSHLELRSDIKKRCQVVLYRDSILQIKKEFNKIVQEVWADKITETEKIKRKNEDIRKVVAELKLGGTDVDIDIFEPKALPLEDPEELLTVKDEEVKVERVLNDEERAAQAEQERLAEERRRLAQLDDPRERGLIDMMDGKLEGKGLEEIWQPIPEPAFMAGTLPETWTDAQKYAAEKYKTELAEREDMREKRRKALQTELGNLQEAVATARKNFDDRVQELFFLKIKTQQKVLQQELKIVLLLRSLQYESDELGNEHELRNDLRKVKDNLPAVAHARDEAMAALDEFRAAHAALDKADKLLERRFKTRLRDYPDAEPHVDHLIRLFKKRNKRRSSVVTALPTSMEELAPALDPDVDMPEGLSPELWDRVVELRDEKLHSELEVNRSAIELARREAFASRRHAEEVALENTVENILEQLDASQQKRFEGATDVEILVPVKQGQMEVYHDSDFEPNYDNTVLIPSRLVEDLNNQVVALGNIKVEHLRSVMQLRTAVHVLEWENKRLKMMAEDHTVNTRAVQLLRVTKDLVRDEGVSLSERHRRENESLEKSIEKLQEALQRTVAQRKKTLREIESKRKSLAREEAELTPNYDDLRVAVQEREVVHKVYVANRGPDTIRQTLKDAAAKRRLQNEVQAQQEDIAALNAELERLRLRTFPTFAAGQRAPF